MKAASDELLSINVGVKRKLYNEYKGDGVEDDDADMHDIAEDVRATEEPIAAVTAPVSADVSAGGLKCAL